MTAESAILGCLKRAAKHEERANVCFSTCWRSPHKFKIYISNLCARTNISNLGWVGIHTRERFTCKKYTVYNLCKWLSMIINDYVYAIYACLRKAGILVGLLLPTVVATPWGPLRSTRPLGTRALALVRPQIRRPICATPLDQGHRAGSQKCFGPKEMLRKILLQVRNSWLEANYRLFKNCTFCWHKSDRKSSPICQFPVQDIVLRCT